MHLWSDYEGKTIAGAYPLGSLIRPEGRSAFFATSNGTGTAAVIRLTESLNDEGEMLERWRQVSELDQENLVQIKRFGETNFEGTPLTYALLEHTDASLAEILAERPLSAEETSEVALSVVAALTALHENGLVHEHVEAANVLAVGEVIKLRSDCVRECILNPEDDTPAHCAELKQRDVQDLATLLLRALTLEKRLTHAMRLPAPFDKIVAHGLDGSWGLAEIGAALKLPVVPVVKPLVPDSVMAAVQVPAQTNAVIDEPATAGPALHMRRIRNAVQPAPRSAGFWVACTLGALLVILLGWRMMRSKPAEKASSPIVIDKATEKAPTKAAPPAPRSQADRHEAKKNVPAAKTAAVAETVVHTPVATSQTQAGWHVVAFTYNHEDQAWHKVAEIRDRHPGLSPEVFAPSGQAPFLVTLSGAMSEAEATAMLNRARRDGMPRDTFIRRYGAR